MLSAGTAWVHFDDKSYWENITDAPLPRREYTKRDDYNLMRRGNRHEIVHDGWIHEQDNLKIIRNNTDFVLAEEINLVKQAKDDLSDLEIDCEACQGKRFNKEILNIKYKGKNIDDILSSIPNLPLQDVPKGIDENYNPPKETWLTIDTGKFNPSEVNVKGSPVSSSNSIQASIQLSASS